MSCPLFDTEEVRVLLAAAIKVPPPPADWHVPPVVEMLWTRFNDAVLRPTTDIHEDEFFFERHWEWSAGGRSGDLTYVNYMGARMEIRRLIWLHESGPVPPGFFPRPVCGWEECVAPHHLRLRPRLNHGQKLSNKERRQAVVAARHDGVSESLAASFGVSVRTVRRLLDRAEGVSNLKDLWP